MDRYSFLRIAMTLDEAKSLLGFSPSDNPSEAEITKAYRAKAFEAHPDRGGSEDQMVQVNVARDVLTGRQRPTYDRSSPSTGPSSPPPPSGGQVRYDKPRAKEVSFNDAKGKAGIPAGVGWLFVTDLQRGTGYSSDEYSRSDTCRVAYGRTDAKHVFVAMRHFVYEQMFIGAGADQDIWTIRSFEFPIKADEGSQPAWLYGNVVKAMKLVDFDGKFNSKVVDAQGWKLDDDKMPRGTGISIKHWLVESGQVAGDAASVAGRKNVVEITYGKSYDAKPDHYKVDRGGYSGDYEAVAIVCNGKPEYLNERDLTKFVKAGLVRRVFGDYTYGGEKKSLTRMKEGKQLIQTILNNFSLSGATRAILEATLAQMK